MPDRKPRNSRLKRGILIAASVLVGYVTLAYAVLPMAWTHHERQEGLKPLPMVTQTEQGIPGDPLNVGLVGSQQEVVRAMSAAGWSPADPVTLRTSIEIAGSVLFDKPYADAPVSPLFYDGRQQDLAFEKEKGASADQRHHIRLWKVLERGAEGRPVWLGSATFDRGVELSRYTGQITHRISPDVDAERDALVLDLILAGLCETIYQVTGAGLTLNGRNGGGDRYYTDGEIKMLVLVGDVQTRNETPVIVPPPFITALKDSIWRTAKNASKP